MDIIPALLVSSQEELLDQVKLLSPHFTHFQIDIADGEFVKNRTVDIDGVQKVVEKHEKLFKNLTLDFDLMVQKYEDALQSIDLLPPSITVQSALPHVSVIEDYSKIFELYPNILLGFAVDPDDSIDTIAQAYDLSIVPVIQIMSVVPGFQGGEFIEDSLTKIEQLRMSDYRNKIYLDGGINESSIKTILSKKYQPDSVCIGSYLTKADDLASRVKKLHTLVGTAA